MTAPMLAQLFGQQPARTPSYDLPDEGLQIDTQVSVTMSRFGWIMLLGWLTGQEMPNGMEPAFNTIYHTVVCNNKDHTPEEAAEATNQQAPDEAGGYM